MKITNILRGADPELFLRTIDTDEPMVSIGLIGGTKDQPRPIGDGYALQEDNVAVEFNIPPAPTKEAFVNSINFVLDHLRKEVGAIGLKLDISPTMEFNEIDLLHPQALHLGCDPDYNAWTLKANPRPIAPPTLRSSGGHLHIGYENPNKKDSIAIVRAHDLFCGVASLTYDSDNLRRSIYGKAGAHRIKPYGVEYRTLSNKWISSDELMGFIYSQSEKAIDFVNNGGEISTEWATEIISTINNGDKDGLSRIDKHFGIL